MRFFLFFNQVKYYLCTSFYLCAPPNWGTTHHFFFTKKFRSQDLAALPIEASQQKRSTLS